MSKSLRAGSNLTSNTPHQSHTTQLCDTLLTVTPYSSNRSPAHPPQDHDTHCPPITSAPVFHVPTTRIRRSRMLRSMILFSSRMCSTYLESLFPLFYRLILLLLAFGPALLSLTIRTNARSSHVLKTQLYTPTPTSHSHSHSRPVPLLSLLLLLTHRGAFVVTGQILPATQCSGRRASSLTGHIVCIIFSLSLE